MFQRENAVLRADRFHFRLQCRGDFARRFIGNNRDALLRLKAEANADGIARARYQFRVNFDRADIISVGHWERKPLREKHRQGNQALALKKRRIYRAFSKQIFIESSA